MKSEDVVWDPSIYPRQKWDTPTIDRYADAMRSGAEFPGIVVEKGTGRLLDGKHTFEAWKKAKDDTPDLPDLRISERDVPNGMTAKYYAATLSADHGLRMANADLEKLAEEEFEIDPSIDPVKWGKPLGVSKSTVYRWVSHIINRAKAGRETKAWRLSQLGWTQDEIGQRLEVDQRTVSLDTKNSHLGKIGETLGENWNEKGVAEWAARLDVPMTDALAAALSGSDDTARLKSLGIKIQPYDVWNFSSCHDLMGDKHPGRIPGELVAHALYYYSEQGDLVVDPMAGSGTTLDACLLMGRKARGYDIDHRHERVDVEQHDIINDGWPDTVEKAKLVFWDPPYFDKMDSGTIGDEGYIEGSISKLSPDGYLGFFTRAFKELSERAKPGTRLAFLMSDWDPVNAKKHSDHIGIYIWDYVQAMRDAGLTLERQVQCPLPTQQVHPDIVNKFREARRMARLGRYLLVARV